MQVGDPITLRSSNDPHELWDVLGVSDPVDVGSPDRRWHNDI